MNTFKGPFFLELIALLFVLWFGGKLIFPEPDDLLDVGFLVYVLYFFVLAAGGIFFTVVRLLVDAREKNLIFLFLGLFLCGALLASSVDVWLNSSGAAGIVAVFFWIPVIFVALHYLLINRLTSKGKSIKVSDNVT